MPEPDVWTISPNNPAVVIDENGLTVATCQGPQTACAMVAEREEYRALWLKANRQTSEGRVAYRCPDCGAESVRWDASAYWDTESGCFALAQTFDEAHCGECDHKIRPIEFDPDQEKAANAPPQT